MSADLIQGSPRPPSPPELMKLFRFDLENGRIFWLNPPKNHQRLIGQEAGSPRRNHHGKLYWHVRVGGRAYKRSHLIYCAVYGRWPAPCLDHKDGDSENDRPCNLREATVTQNAWNHKRRARRETLPMGVRTLRSGRFQARISCNGRQIHLGSYETPEAAQAAYRVKREELFGEFA